MKKSILLALFVVLFSGPVNALEFGDVNIHGYLSQGYIKTDKYNYLFIDSEEGSLEFNEFGINFSTTLSDRLQAGCQIRAADLGDVGNNEIVIDWAYGDYRFNNLAGLRVGKFRRATGLYNEVRDIDASRTIIFLPATIAYTESYRDVTAVLRGACLYGNISFLGLEYQLMYGLGGMPLESGLARTIEGLVEEVIPGTYFESVDEELNYTLHFQWNVPFLYGLTLGFTTLRYDLLFENGNHDPDNASSLQTVELNGINNAAFARYYWGEMAIVLEYFWQKSTFVYQPFNLEDESSPESFYSMITYRFTDWFELGAYYMEFYFDKEDRSGKDQVKKYESRGRILPPSNFWLKDFNVATRFDINDFWILKLEGHFMNGLSGVDFSPRDDPDDQWFMFAAKVTYSF